MKIFIFLAYLIICSVIATCFKEQIGDYMYFYGYIVGCMAMAIPIK